MKNQISVIKVRRFAALNIALVVAHQGPLVESAEIRFSEKKFLTLFMHIRIINGLKFLKIAKGKRGKR